MKRQRCLVGERAREHINVGMSVPERFDRAEVSQLPVEAENSYQRYIRARFTGFAYMGLQDKWQPIGSFIFGNAAVLSIQNNADGSYSFSNILYVCEDASQALSEQRRIMHDPDSLVFDRISEEVFGDG